MRVLPFIAVAWLFAGLEEGLASLFQVGQSGVQPSFLFALVVLAALLASQGAALWTALALGLLKDLLNHLPSVEPRETILALGPYALGYLLAAQFILAMRGVMNRKNPFTFAFLALVGSALAQAVLVALVSIRAAYDQRLLWDASDELLRRLGTSASTAAAALVLALVLLPLAPALGMPAQPQRRFMH